MADERDLQGEHDSLLSLSLSLSALSALIPAAFFSFSAHRAPAGLVHDLDHVLNVLLRKLLAQVRHDHPQLRGRDPATRKGERQIGEEGA